MSAPDSSIETWVVTANRYCASPSWISRATRARSSATARRNSVDADRAPDADEQHGVRNQAQEVALRDERRARERGEDEVDRSEEHQRQTEREPAVQILCARAEAVAETDHSHEVDERKHRQGGGEQVRDVASLGGLEVGQAEPEQRVTRPRRERARTTARRAGRRAPCDGARRVHRRMARPRTSTQPIRIPTMPAHVSVRCSGRPVTAGPTAKAAHASEVVKKPPHRTRSKRRPSAAKRLAVSSATRPPPTAYSVIRTSRSSGRWYSFRSTGLERKIASAPPSSPTRIT